MVFVSASIAMGWTRVDSSIGTGARVDMSLSINFNKSVICVAVAIKSLWQLVRERPTRQLMAAASLYS
uniref:Uncharacterized protein n=1 Tax=Romanomermis culicivorax TaxID=13658 RepID=A0A915I9S6_ROMCU